jgi:type IV secretory pathway VirB4 component
MPFVMLDPDTRRRHLYVIGQTSTGKSTLLLNLIAQDLAAGQIGPTANKRWPEGAPIPAYWHAR